MAAVTFNTKRSGCYLGETAALNIVNEEIVVISGAGVLDAGTVLGRITEGGTQTVSAAVAAAGNTGNGTVGSLTGDAGTAAGTWTLLAIEPGSNAGTFEVVRPDGAVDGVATVGVAYNGTINFTIADGSTDFVAGDRFTIAVSHASSTKYALHDAAGNDGREVATAILFHTIDATSGDVVTVATVNGPATINGNMLTWKSGISNSDKAAGLAALRAKGLKVLPQHA